MKTILKSPTFMNFKSAENLCPRCHKPRIKVKEWREKINGSWVTYTETTCPDPECQKQVDQKIADIKEKREKLMARNKNPKAALRRRTDIKL